MEENNPNSSYGELLSHSESQVWSIYYHPVVGFSVNPPVYGYVSTFCSLSFYLAVEEVSSDSPSLVISSKNCSLTSYNRFYFTSFEMFIMLVNLLFIFFLWNRQDKDAQLACFAKKVLYYLTLAACLFAKSFQNIFLSF